VATQGSPDLQKSTAKQNSAVCITGVNKIAPNFDTLVATYVYDVRLFKYLYSATYIYIYAIRQLMVNVIQRIMAVYCENIVKQNNMLC